MIPFPQRFAGKHALVTGGGSGIGRAISVRLAAEGAHVAVLERSAEAGAETVAEIVAAGGSAQVLAADVSHTEEMEAVGLASDRFQLREQLGPAFDNFLSHGNHFVAETFQRVFINHPLFE